MTAAVRITSMKQSDLDAVMALAAQLPEAPQWPRSAYEAAVDSQTTPARVCLVASTAGWPVAGFVIASLVDAQAELESIGVAKECQGQGIGRALIDELKRELRAWGVDEVLLEVRASNRAAIALYLTSGFTRTGIRQGYYRNPDEDAVVYSASLA